MVMVDVMVNNDSQISCETGTTKPLDQEHAPRVSSVDSTCSAWRCIINSIDWGGILSGVITTQPNNIGSFRTYRFPPLALETVRHRNPSMKFMKEMGELSGVKLHVFFPDELGQSERQAKVRTRPWQLRAWVRRFASWAVWAGMTMATGDPALTLPTFR